MPGGRILVIVSSSDRDKAALALRWAAKLKRESLVEDVRVYFFGPAEELVAREDPAVMEGLRMLHELGVEVLACHGVAERAGYDSELRRVLGDDRVTHVGELIPERVREGYVPLVF